MMQKSHDDRMLWAQFDALEMGTGWDDTDIEKPQIMVESVYGDSHPGSWHLNQLVEQAAVSYTHLDVYKRQVQEHPVKHPAAHQDQRQQGLIRQVSVSAKAFHPISSFPAVPAKAAFRGRAVCESS